MTGYSPWFHKELDTTERLSLYFTLIQALSDKFKLKPKFSEFLGHF